jgi:hypothetical protein
MSKAIIRTRKSRGRPPTGAESVHLRILPEQSAAIAAWIAKQKEPEISRPEAIRRLVELGLKATQPVRTIRSAPNKLRAAELAATAIDTMHDPVASTEERDERRRRLTKGPPEFRDVRVDRPKAKGK